MANAGIERRALAPANPDALAVGLPAYGSEWEAMGETGAAGMPLSFYWHLLWRYRWHIVTFVLLVTAAATLVALVLPKQYQSTAILRIDPAGHHAMGAGLSGESGIPVSARRLITTEANVVTSPAVVLQTINKLRLYRIKQFAPRHVAATAALSEAQMNQVLSNVTKAISVSQPLDTYLLSVSFRSASPALSAQVANSLLHSLIQHEYDTRVRALMGSSRSMRAQMTKLRAKMERSQSALVHYESKHNVLNPGSKNNIMIARLSQVNQDLGAAQTRRMALQADYQIAQADNLDALIASSRGKYLQPLYTRLLSDRRRLARMAQVYGPNYPILRQQQSLVNNDSAVLSRQERHIAGQIDSQYRMALAREKLLHRELAVQKRNMDAFNLKAIRYFALKAASDSYTKLYYQLQQRIQDATVAANLHAESLRIISPARPEQKPVYPRPLLTAFLAFVVSGFLAVGAAIAVGVMDKSIASPDQIEQWFKLPVLSTLPLVAQRDRAKLAPFGYGAKLLVAGTAADEPGQSAESRAIENKALGNNAIANREPSQRDNNVSAFREGILTLHSAIMLAREQDLRTLCVTSSIPGEGKSTVAANLAAAFAGMGRRTILVDVDMRKPTMNRQFNLPNRRGLSSLLRGQCGLEQVLVEAIGIPNLTLLTAGPPPNSPAELLHVNLAEHLEQLIARYDMVLFDCPPILGFADTLAITNLLDGCLLVVRAGQTERQLVAGSLRQLRAARARMLGVVLNGVSSSLGSYYNYYNHYYGSSPSEADEGAEGSEA